MTGTTPTYDAAISKASGRRRQVITAVLMSDETTRRRAKGDGDGDGDSDDGDGDEACTCVRVYACMHACMYACMHERM